VTYKFKPFNSAGDMDDPKFKTGMVFDSVEVVRKAVSRYAINERVQIRKIRNNEIRFEAVCEGKTSNGEVCKWKFIAVNGYFSLTCIDFFLSFADFFPHLLVII
jgi:hypothetical protein